MNIIQKLIIRNRLKKELNSVESFLINSDYYSMLSQLNAYIYKPDEYANLLQQINNKFQPTLNKKHSLEDQIRDLSGRNLFKRIDELKK